MSKVYLLESKLRSQKEDIWRCIGVYTTYKKAQDVLILQKGLRRIREVTLR